jgi:hypothetical protein
MWIFNFSLRIIDWFIPDAAKSERSELSLARNFVFTHLAGPLLSQSISMFLYLSDPNPGFACWTMIISIWLFWTLPFVYKWTGNLQATAMVTVELLAFASLFGAFFYGGVSSPFLPWLIVSLLLGFFYLAKSPSLRCPFRLGLPGSRFEGRSRDRWLDFDFVSDDLHVLDGHLLRQYDVYEFRD